MIKSLIGLIAAINLNHFHTNSNQQAVKIIPTLLAHADTENLTPSEAQLFAAEDTNRISGSIVKHSTKKSPYIGVLKGGSMEGISGTQRVVVSENAAIGTSLVRPEFVLSKDVCGTSGGSAKVGSTEFSYSPKTLRGKGPLVCVKGTWAAFKDSYNMAETALRDQLTRVKNADVRISMVDAAGCSLVARSGKTFGQMFDGGINQINTPFTADFVPDSPLNVKLLQRAASTLREDLGVDPYEDTPDGTLRMIAGIDTLQLLRDEVGVREDFRYIAASGDKIGKQQLTGYKWEGPYRGFAFGVDPEPLRFNLVDGGGQPIYIEPGHVVEVTNGFAYRPNPAWLNAKYEVATISGMGSLKYLSPEVATGEGSFKWPAQNTSGVLKFKVIEDNDNNAWGDFGRHFYQIERAIRPEKPHAILKVAFARPRVADFDLTPITDFGNWSSTSSF